MSIRNAMAGISAAVVLSLSARAATAESNIISGHAPLCLYALTQNFTSAAGPSSITVLLTNDCSDDGREQFSYDPNTQLLKVGGRCVTPTNLDVGAIIKVTDCNSMDIQQWRMNGKQITSALNGLCMDIKGGSQGKWGQVILWSCHGGTNQQWAAMYIAKPAQSGRSVQSFAGMAALAADAAAKINAGVLNAVALTKVNAFGSVSGTDALKLSAAVARGTRFTMPIGNNLANVTPINGSSPLNGAAP